MIGRNDESASYRPVSATGPEGLPAREGRSPAGSPVSMRGRRRGCPPTSTPARTRPPSTTGPPPMAGSSPSRGGRATWRISRTTASSPPRFRPVDLRALTCPVDPTKEEQCRRLIDTAVGLFGAIDILVNNAAYQMAQQGGIEDITTEQFDRVLKTNLYATFWHPRLHQGHGAAAGRQGHLGELRRARADLDAAHPGDDARGAGVVTRAQRPDGTGRAAGRAGAGVCLLRF